MDEGNVCRLVLRYWLENSEKEYVVNFNYGYLMEPRLSFVVEYEILRVTAHFFRYLFAVLMPTHPTSTESSGALFPLN